MKDVDWFAVFVTVLVFGGIVLAAFIIAARGRR
jgi:hypothetical protein